MQEFSERISSELHRGVKRRLVPWLKMPTDPPQLPGGDRQALEVFRPSPGFLSYMKWWFWVVAIIIDLVILFVWMAITIADLFMGLLLSPIVVVMLFLPDVIAYIAIHLRYENTWYAMTDRAVRIRRGVWIVRETTISFENVQNVKVRQGPVQRMFNISDVVIETAGSGGASQGKGGSFGVSNQGVIEGIEEAARIRDLVLSRMRTARTAGLGDEVERPRSAGRRRQRGGGFSVSKDHVRILREIRDLLRAE